MSAVPIGEPLWHPADTIVYEVGSAEPETVDTDRPVAVLWIPDPEQRHGWREYYVKQIKTVKPGAKRMGYQPDSKK